MVTFVTIDMSLSLVTTASKSYNDFVYFDNSSTTLIVPDLSSTANGTKIK